MSALDDLLYPLGIDLQGVWAASSPADGHRRETFLELARVIGPTFELLDELHHWDGQPQQPVEVTVTPFLVQLLHDARRQYVAWAEEAEAKEDADAWRLRIDAIDTVARDIERRAAGA